MATRVDRILTTHVGSLPRPTDLIALYRNMAPTANLELRLKSAVAEVVQQQVAAGIDVVDDGEYGKPMIDEVDYGAWSRYVFGRLGGFELREVSGDLDVFGTILGESKDYNDFADFYRSGEADMHTGGSGPMKMPINVGPITYTGQAALQRDIANLKAAIAGRQVTDAFIPAVVTSISLMPCEYYKNAEEQAVAVAEAVREEYRAIVDAGFMVQLDDPILVNQYEMHHSMNADLAGFRSWAERHIELVNHGLAGIPEDRVRYHVCWGSWKGPHSSDLALESVLDLVLRVKASQYSVEAANPQHEHEWQCWKDVKLPAGKVVLPGVVTHKTNILEHPQVVADRILRYADAVGRENVIASTDCGMGGRIHPSLAWAKLKALSAGAALASERLWGQRAAAG